MRPTALLPLLLLPLLPVAPAATAAPTAAAARADAFSEAADHLAHGRLDEAAAALEGASDADADLWRLRVQAARGEYREVLSAVSRLKREGRSGPALDYATGGALLAQAQAEIAAGGGSSTGLVVEDAKGKLAAAHGADPVRYAEAGLAGARAARLAGDREVQLGLARAASERFADVPEAWFLLGDAALARHAATRGEGEPPRESKQLLDEAVDALDKAVDLSGEPTDAAAISLAAQAAALLGTAHAFAGDLDAAADAYGRSIGLDPAAPPYDQWSRTLWTEDEGSARFLSALTAGVAAAEQRYGERNAALATPLWWLGYSAFASPTEGEARLAALAQGEEAFQRAVTLYPPYSNSHFYVFLIRYDRALIAGGGWPECAEAFLKWTKVEGDGAVHQLRQDQLSKDKAQFVVGQAAGANRRILAADVSRVLAQVEVRPDKQAEQWNNVGLFLRDETDLRGLREGRLDDDPEAKAEALELCERSLEAYEQAIELQPSDPSYLNDAAVLLHYYLHRDYEHALEMYEKAAVEAEKLLESDDLDPELEPVYRIALRDARNNKRILERLLKGEGDGTEEG